MIELISPLYQVAGIKQIFIHNFIIPEALPSIKWRISQRKANLFSVEGKGRDGHSTFTHLCWHCPMSSSLKQKRSMPGKMIGSDENIFARIQII